MGNVRFAVQAHEGVGPIRFGMSRAEIEKTMRKTPKRGRKGGTGIAVASVAQNRPDFSRPTWTHEN